jgi:hypothetical protein
LVSTCRSWQTQLQGTLYVQCCSMLAVHQRALQAVDAGRRLPAGYKSTLVGATWCWVLGASSVNWPPVGSKHTSVNTCGCWQILVTVIQQLLAPRGRNACKHRVAAVSDSCLRSTWCRTPLPGTQIACIDFTRPALHALRHSSIPIPHQPVHSPCTSRRT